MIYICSKDRAELQSEHWYYIISKRKLDQITQVNKYALIDRDIISISIYYNLYEECLLLSYRKKE